MRIVPLCLALVGLLCVTAPSRSGDPPSDDDVKELAQRYGADHPLVLAAKARLAAAAEPAPEARC